MSRAKTLARHLERTVTGPMWHGPALVDVLAGVTAGRARQRPIAGAHSIWELVLHITVWCDIARQRITGQAIGDPTPEEDWPPVPITGPGSDPKSGSDPALSDPALSDAASSGAALSDPALSDAASSGAALSDPALSDAASPDPASSDPADLDWRLAVDRLGDSHRRLAADVRLLDDAQLDALVPGLEYSVSVLLSGVVEHGTYHGGQIALLKRAGGQR